MLLENRKKRKQLGIIAKKIPQNGDLSRICSYLLITLVTLVEPKGYHQSEFLVPRCRGAEVPECWGVLGSVGECCGVLWSVLLHVMVGHLNSKKVTSTLKSHLNSKKVQKIQKNKKKSDFFFF